MCLDLDIDFNDQIKPNADLQIGFLVLLVL